MLLKSSLFIGQLLILTSWLGGFSQAVKPGSVEAAARFAQTAGRMGELSRCCYDPPIKHFKFGGATHYPTRYKTDHSRIYRYVDRDFASYVFAFAGTRINQREGLGDILRDAEGVFGKSRPYNIWTGTYSTGRVGGGYYSRVRTFMTNVGEGLLPELWSLHDRGKKIEFHLTGHSLGGAVAQLFSYFLAEYLEQRGFASNSYKIHVFSFQTPKVSDYKFSEVFKYAQRRYPISVYSFTRAGDPVSELGFGLEHIQEKISEPQRETNYCVHKQFTSFTPEGCLDLKNHVLETLIADIYNPALWIDSARCMSSNYQSNLPHP